MDSSTWSPAKALSSPPTVREVEAGNPADEAVWEQAAGATGSPGPAAGVRLIALQEGVPRARAALLTCEGLTGAPGVTGMIAHFGATGPEAREAAIAVLREGTRRLLDGGADRVVGPMDGSTWDRYRLALSPPDGAPEPPPFLTEPVNPPEWPVWFEEAGFRPVERYLSRLVPLDALEERARGLDERLAEAGIGIVALDRSRFDAALDEIHALSLAAFAENPYYAPIGREVFRAMYEPVRQFLVPDLVLLARRGDELVGFVFGFPDLLDPAAREGTPGGPGGAGGPGSRGRPTRVVAKSMAVAPDARGSGLGSLLLHEFNRRAAAAGFSAVIHALMHVENASHRISRRGGDVYREYALYGVEP